MPTLLLEYWSIDKFHPYEKNPRKNDAAVNKMVASIKEFGFAVPILARSDGTIVDGHLRLKGAEKAKSWPGGDTTTIPVIICDGWSDAQVKAFRLMVNKSVSWAEWDLKLLADEFAELKALNFDLKLTGFDWHEVNRGVGMENLYGTTPEEKSQGAKRIQDQWGVDLGQTWDIPSINNAGTHRLMVGDSTTDIPKLLEGEVPDGICSDPDYGMPAPEVRKACDASGCESAIMLMGDTQAFEFSTLWTFRMLIVFKHRNRLGVNTHLPLRNFVLSPIFTKNPKVKHGFHKSEPGFSGLQEDVPGGCYEGGGDEEDYPFGQQKSAAVFEIMMSGFPWKVVLDPFAGTGASLLACELHSRRWLGMELDPAHAACALERAKKLGMTPVLRA